MTEPSIETLEATRLVGKRSRRSFAVNTTALLKKYLLSVLVILLVSCGKKDRDPVLTIAVAANMQFAMEELALAFTESSGVPCDLIIGSSGKLTAQIVEGAPFDVFVSADMKYPGTLAEKSLVEGQPQVYAYGSLVLWSISDSLDLSLSALKAPAVKHIALANPKTAPYGRAAVEVLRHYGIYDAVADKLVFGESIAQTNQFIISGAAEAGFTALSVVSSKEMTGRGRWISPDPASYDPISQGVVVLRGNSGVHPDAKAFRDFLFSAPGREILSKFGYYTDE